MTNKEVRSDNFLAGDISEDSLLFQKLLLEAPSVQENNNNEVESKLVAPKPGWCIKTWLKNGEKIFINVCTSELVLKPKDLPEDEVREIVESDDPTKFRIPMGIGEAHKEKDKTGLAADAYDIVIHPSFLEKCKQIQFFKDFFIMLIFDGLEDKYQVELGREYKILKNRKCIGTLQMQNVRNKSKPFIMEMDPTMYEMEKEMKDDYTRNNVSELPPTTSSEMSEISSKRTASTSQSLYVTPTFTITHEPPQGYPEYLVVEVELPKQMTSSSMILDVGEDCLILYANDGNYKLDIDLPCNVDNNNTGAQFNRRNKQLTVTIPVVRKS